MGQNRFRYLAVIAALIAFPWWLQAQTVPVVVEEGPSETDILCSGFFSQRNLDTGTVVLGSEDAGYKNEFADRDLVYVSQGTGTAASPGTEYLLIRPVHDPDRGELFPGQQQLLLKMGVLYAAIARIRIVALHGGSMSAEVVRACDSAVAGDVAIPVPAHPVLRYRTDRMVDRLAPASGKAIGGIVAAKDFQTTAGQNGIVYLSLGSNQGAAVGQYVRIFRGYGTGYDAKFQKDTDEYATGIEGQPMGRKLSQEERATLPRMVMGEVLILSVGENSATGIVTFSRSEISPGDQAELE